MRPDKKRLYILTISTLALLLIACFLSGQNSGRIAAAILLAPLTVLVWFLVKKRGIPSMNRQTVTLLLGVIGLVYLILYFLTGISFGFLRNPSFLKLGYILPIATVIVSTEVIRWIVRAQGDKWADLITYFLCVIAEVLALGNLHGIHNFPSFMDLLALTVFPSVVGGILYHYLSLRYGPLPNLIYRGLTTLAVYFIPVSSAIPDSLLAFARLFVPLAVLLFIDTLFEKKRRYALQKKSKVAPIVTAVAVLILAGFIMLISNQFQYGALVIATDSMTGELNKGDVSIFESYEGQAIEKGQIIVFEKNGSMIVHRVVDIQRVNGQTQYFTKGDANEEADGGFVTRAQIVGIVQFKVPYVGYPTLWLRSLFEK